MSLNGVLKCAERELGVTEFPKDSNKVVYNTEYYGYEASGVYFPWCVTFLWWVFKHGGDSMAFFNSGKTASCSALKKLYQAEGLLIMGFWYSTPSYMTLNRKASAGVPGLGTEIRNDTFYGLTDEWLAIHHAFAMALTGGSQ